MLGPSGVSTGTDGRGGNERQPDLETCARSRWDRPSAQADRRRLWGQLGQGVVLVHELRQRAGADELFDSANDGRMLTRLCGDLAVLLVLQGHTLTDDALHAGEADAELVLRESRRRAADTTVAQVVDLVGHDTVVTAQQVVDGSEDVIDGDGG